MSEGTQMIPGTICWTELMTENAAAASDFYSKLIGWETSEVDLGENKCVLLIPPGTNQPVGGITPMDGPEWNDIPTHWMTYIAVDDVDEGAKRCKELGGTVKLPPTDIPEIGRFCVIQDPTGGIVSLFKSL